MGSPRYVAVHLLLPRLFEERGAQALLDAIREKNDPFFVPVWMEAGFRFQPHFEYREVSGWKFGLLSLPTPREKTEAYLGAVVVGPNGQSHLMLWEKSIDVLTGADSTFICESTRQGHRTYGKGPLFSGNPKDDYDAFVTAVLDVLTDAPPPKGSPTTSPRPRPRATAGGGTALPQSSSLSPSSRLWLYLSVIALVILVATGYLRHRYSSDSEAEVGQVLEDLADDERRVKDELDGIEDSIRQTKTGLLSCDTLTNLIASRPDCPDEGSGKNLSDVIFKAVDAALKDAESAAALEKQCAVQLAKVEKKAQALGCQMPRQ